VIVIAFFLDSLLATKLEDLMVSIHILNLGLAIAVFGAAIVVGLIYFENLTPANLS
jgi:hypothetical protein